MTKWILRTDVPYRGHSESILREDGTVEYTNGQTLEEYKAERGFPFRIVNDEELMELDNEFKKTFITLPKIITLDVFDYALDVLPPCRLGTYGSFFAFHIVERITHNLVSWYAQRNDTNWEFVDYDNIKAADLAQKMNVAYLLNNISEPTTLGN